MHNQDIPNPEEMLRKLILFFVIKTKGHMTKIQLVKFLYLADLYAVKWTGQQLTNLEWVFYTHGPWEQGIDDALRKMEGLSVRTVNEGNAQLMKPASDADTVEDLGLPQSLTLMLENIRRAWAGSGRERIRELLKYVYNTEPMKQAQAHHRPEDQVRLDLSLETQKLAAKLGE